jgi:hypothetical protein
MKYTKCTRTHMKIRMTFQKDVPGHGKRVFDPIDRSLWCGSVIVHSDRSISSSKRGGWLSGQRPTKAHPCASDNCSKVDVSFSDKNPLLDYTAFLKKNGLCRDFAQHCSLSTTYKTGLQQLHGRAYMHLRNRILVTNVRTFFTNFKAAQLHCVFIEKEASHPHAEGIHISD